MALLFCGIKQILVLFLADAALFADALLSKLRKETILLTELCPHPKLVIQLLWYMYVPQTVQPHFILPAHLQTADIIVP